MLEPISARLASSFSRNGTRAAATDTSCLGDTSMKFTWSGVVITKLPPLRQDTSSSVRRRRLSTVALAWAMVNFASSIADR
jgi:hypothetical protein